MKKKAFYLLATLIFAIFMTIMTAFDIVPLPPSASIFFATALIICAIGIVSGLFE